MAKKTTEKNIKGKKVLTSKKVETKNAKKNKVDTKVVETKVEVKKAKKEKKGNLKAIVDKAMRNTPFVISLCVILVLVGALLFTLSYKKIPVTTNINKLLATVNGEAFTLKDLKEILVEQFGEDTEITLSKTGDEVVASIKGKKITANDLYEELKKSYGTDALINIIDTYIADKEVEINDENKEYVQEVVDYYKDYAKYYSVDLATFLSNYVGINGIETEDEFYDYVLEDYKKTLAITNYIGENASEDDLKKYYKENYSDKLTVKHILIEVDSEAEDTKAAEKEAYNKAKDLIKKLKDTSSKKLDAKFEELAEDNSDDTATYSNGGLIEDFGKTDVVKEFWEASEKLKDGEYTTEPVKTTYGYHIILKVSSTPVEEYKDIKDEVKTAYAESKLSSDSTLAVTIWDEIRNQYKLSIQDDFIKRTYKQTIKDATKKTED